MVLKNTALLILSTIVTAVFLFILALPISVSAAGEPKNAQYNAIGTFDDSNLMATLWDSAKQLGAWAKDYALKQYEWLRDEGIALAYKKALNRFLQTLAKDTATYLVTGKKGQGPMFATEGWGEYLKNAADSAAGTLLEELGSEGLLGFNLCEPDLQLRLRIGLGLARIKNPGRPDCTFTEMRQNWQEALDDENFLVEFGGMYEPQQNSFGIALSMHNQMLEAEAVKEKAAELERLTNGGFKDVTEPISGNILTPGNAIRDYMSETWTFSTSQYYTYTGHAVADAIDTFTNTLIKKLVDSWLRKGLAKKSKSTAYKGDWGGFLSASMDGSSSGGSGGSATSGAGGSAYGGSGSLGSSQSDPNAGTGIASAKEDFKSLDTPNFKVGGDFDVLMSLSICTDPTNAKTDECVITDSFRQAIEDRLTLGQAIQGGNINKDSVFGFLTNGIEPNFNEGLPYRSMMILRKYRIIPVGWELAAQYILDHQNELKRTFSIADMVACYDPSNGSDDRYPGFAEEWCAGLVDPTWVLKAPQNFCKREGPGQYIVSSQIMGEKEKSKLSVNRDASYCADTQSCIKEGDDGACELYGYCSEERRRYDYNGESCEPIYNSCEQFRGADGSTVGYLKNSLDYGTSSVSCTADNSGCEAYKRFDVDDMLSYVAGADGKLDWAQASTTLRLDATAASCDASKEGCRKLIRTKPGVGSNLLTNPSFEDASDALYGWGSIGTIVDDSKEGTNALTLSSELDRRLVIEPYFRGATSSYDLSDDIYVLSLYVKNCPATAGISLNGTTTSLYAEDWRFVSIAKDFSLDGGKSGNEIIVQSSGASGCTIDAVKLERSAPSAKGVATQYVPYAGVGSVYEKLLPERLFDRCYQDANNDGFLEKRKDAPSDCDKFARACTAAEASCELYTPVGGQLSVPAAVGAGDYCPEECVGFDSFIQTTTNFEPSAEKFFVPATGAVCQAEAAGCDAFTNLDEMDGPEDREYYIHLKRCVESDAPTCQPFFMWEGNDESGYQLKIHRLDTVGGRPARLDPAETCSIDITSPDYDANCREYYDQAGNVYYELYYNTISCTDNCYSYRRAAADETQANCEAHGGTWTDNSVCVYKGIPGEGVACEAENAGCREYNGTTGANTRTLFQYSFERGTNENWIGGVNSNASAIAGQHSLLIASSASLLLGADVSIAKSYHISFLATSLGSASTSINAIYFENPTTGERTQSLVAAISLLGRWEAYEGYLQAVDHEVDAEKERLVIEGDAYIDNIILTEVTDRHYLIEESWKDDCDHIDADPARPLWTDPGHYAGCRAYTDSQKAKHNLFQFRNLCTDEAVGCELMIDTQNSSDYKSKIWFDDNGNGTCDPGEADCVSVPADRFIYAVYNKNNLCRESEKGCEMLGLRYSYSYPDIPNYYQYFDAYRLNDPDKYDQALCQEAAVDCASWETEEGTSYFKDPSDMVCEWRIENNEGIGKYGWFTKQVNRCDENGDGRIATGSPAGMMQAMEKRLCKDAGDCGMPASGADTCLSDDDCAGSAVCYENSCRQACILDDEDYACRTDNDNFYPPKTLGYGGISNRVRQPLGDMEGSDWVSACPASQSGCTEYIDPQSKFSFDVDTLKPYTLYVASSTDLPECQTSSGVPFLSSKNVFYFDPTTNSFLASSSVTSVVDALDSSKLIYYATTTECRFDPDKFSMRPAVVDYQVESTLDKSTCNGMVDLEQNCILLNERVRVGQAGMSELTYNADPLQYKIPSPPSSQKPLDTNVLLKVVPDRTCNSWLACRSFVKDAKGNDVCYDVGACERLDDNGNCSYFVGQESNPASQSYPDVLDIQKMSNMSGYSRVGYVGNTLKADYFAVGDMKQVGQTAKVPNGSFEQYDQNFYPLGWVPAKSANGVADDWTPDQFRVVNNPVSAQKEGVSYPVDGRSFLKFGARDGVMSEPLNLVAGQSYVLTFYINTKNLAKGSANFHSTIGAGPKTYGRSMDWTMEMINFTASGNLDGRVIFETLPDSDGNVFIDMVEIKSALEVRDDWKVPQTCRLYPESSALSCDYYDDSGHRKKGWPGYCMEYDRYPGDKKSCLTWYPIDRVNGDGVEEGGGYLDRYPLYYCVNTEAINYSAPHFTVPVAAPSKIEDFVIESNLGAQTSGDIDIIHQNPFGLSTSSYSIEQLGLGSVDPKWLKWENIDHIRIHHTSPSVTCDGKLSDAWDFYYSFDENNIGEDCFNSGGDDCQPWGTPHQGGRKTESANFVDQWFETTFGWCIGFDCDDEYDDSTTRGGIRILSEDGSFSGIYLTNYDVYCDHPDYHITEVVIFPKSRYCKDLIQTVTPTGQNRYYSAHVYEGSEYGNKGEVPCNPNIPYAEYTACKYMSDFRPFGAVFQPGLPNDDWAVMSNPYMWDTREGWAGKQPLFFEMMSEQNADEEQARMGQEYNEGTVLDNLFGRTYGRWTFTPDAGSDVSQVTGQYDFSGGVGVRAGKTSPVVANMKTVPDSGKIFVNKLVNLTFTSDVDENQMPLTMYSVDWGDGNFTTVSGVDMRDRPSVAAPHSLYHIYSKAGGYTIRIKLRDNWQMESAWVGLGITVNEDY